MGISNTPGKIEHRTPGKIGSPSNIAWSCNLSIGPRNDPVGKWLLPATARYGVIAINNASFYFLY